MTTMRDELIKHSITLVRVRGYAAFSYADLSDAVGIRKPSIHHYFPAKEDLGEAIVESYSDDFFRRLDIIDGKKATARDKIAAYADIYRDSLQADQACLCGMLAAEVSILPDKVRAAVTRFFERNLRWLEGVLSQDDPKRQRSGAQSPADSRARAKLVLGSLQGALLVARSLGRKKVFDDAVKGVLDAL